MKEEFLHYIWNNKLFTPKKYKSDSGEEIEIIDTGVPNSDSGPDFFNGKIKSGNTIWAGNIEIHLKASDWYNHQHQINPLYDNVILHVVYNCDKKVHNSRGTQIQTIEIDFPDYLLQNYYQLKNDQYSIPCETRISDIDPLHISMWIENLAIERIEKKTIYIEDILEKNRQNWEESFYQILARSYGFGVNSEPFEMLAKSTPLKILTKHKSRLTEIEALLFGQSGILEMNERHGTYPENLFELYDHLKNKYKLKPIDGFTWKFLRLRPVNFPTVRIAQFASFIFNSSNLFSKIMESDNLKLLTSLLQSKTSTFWENHYHFGKESEQKMKPIGKESVYSIIINSIVPFLYLYGEKTGKEDIKNRAFNFLHELPKERNSIINKWKELGIDANNSFESQALIHLKKEYCNLKKCLWCKTGNMIITKH